LLTFDVVTTYAERHWEAYAKRCVESFGKYWQGIDLVQFKDADLIEGSEWLGDFLKRHADKPTDNYRFDACRFAYKVAAMELAFYGGVADTMIWLDADCVTHAPVDRRWLSMLVGRSDIAYLPRSRKYSETGFIAFKRNPASEQFIANLVELYKTDELFSLKEWHDSWAFDVVKAKLGANVKYTSLSGAAEHTGHPFINGPLGERLDHCKGGRKVYGRSHARDLKVKRTEAHWRD